MTDAPRGPLSPEERVSLESEAEFKLSRGDDARTALDLDTALRAALERAEKAEKEAERKTRHAARRDMDLRRSHAREKRLLDCRGTNEVQALVIGKLKSERDAAHSRISELERKLAEAVRILGGHHR